MRLAMSARFPSTPAPELGRQALGSPLAGLPTRLPGPAEPVPGPAGPAQFIELRHNVQKGLGPGGSPFPGQGPPPRPRFYPVSEEPHRLVPEGLRSVAASGLPPQKPSAPPAPDLNNSLHQTPHTKGPALPTGLELVTRPPSSTELGRPPLALEAGKLPCEDPELDDDFDAHKALEDDEELAHLGLGVDVAKGDDELSTLENLETNDPHLDDLLNGDEFDLLAYTDPELDTGDKKDIFNEHLRLVESANEKAEREALLRGVEPVSLGPEERPPPATDNAEPRLTSVHPEVKPKVEEGGRHPSPCQFTINTPKMEPAPSAAPLSLGLKPGQTVLGSRDPRVGTGPFPSSGHTAEKGPFGTTGGTPAHLLNPGSLSGPAGSSLLEKFELESGALALPSGHAAPGDELDKMESSLVASELPLLIEDLLEHEKKELQKKQQLSAQLQPAQQQPQQQPQPQHSLLPAPGPAQTLPLPHEAGPPQQLALGLGSTRQPGLGQSLMPTQSPAHALQQRLAPAVPMVANQGHMLSGQQAGQTGLVPQQSSQPVLAQKPMNAMPAPMCMKPQQLAMQQQQLANSFFPDTGNFTAAWLREIGYHKVL